MRVLVLNAGSTSLKYRLLDMETQVRLATGELDRLGGQGPARHVWTEAAGQGARTETDVAAATLDDAVKAVLMHLKRNGGPLAAGAVLDAVGHRVVHGGERLVAPVVVDERVRETIRECATFAPLHNLASLAVIDAARAALPAVRHVAVFDTAFHAHLPPHAFTYALPRALYLAHGIRRYGFHGPSHQYVSLAAAKWLGADVARLRIVSCHLGGGASVCAIDGGVSVEISMGMTPLEGLVMGTRSGDVDPALPFVLWREAGIGPEEYETILNEHSGLAGLSGIASGDFRDVETAARSGDPSARLAIDVFVHRIRKYVGGYAAILGGADAIVFTGGIGENSASVRTRVCEGLLYMGISLDPAKNERLDVVAAGGAADVSAERAPTRVLVIATDEEKMIARDVVRCLRGPAALSSAVAERTIPVGISMRHVHLSRGDCDALFGPGAVLARRRDATQKGEYVTRETVDVVGPKGELRGVAIILPLRSATQVEVTRSDADTLGVSPPVRESGELSGTPGVVLRGLRGSVTLDDGVTIPKRHVHMSPADATAFGVHDGDIVTVHADGDLSSVTPPALRTRD